MFSTKNNQQTQRLSSGGLIDRSKPIAFKFDGKPLMGYDGDTLASALLANNIKLVGRSFKYHRPRGIYTAGTEEPNALVSLRSKARTEPNTRATNIELFDGLEAKSQNRWPNLFLDFMQINNLAGPLFTAGFYYKTFMGMPGWHFYEHFIRKAAGMGSTELERDPDAYDKKNAFCDILIIGGGPTGLSAALTAGRSGARVLIIDSSKLLGGQLIWELDQIDGKPALQWIESVLEELKEMKNVTIARRTTAFGYYDSNVVNAIESVSDHLPTPELHTVRQRLWQIRAQKVIIATGATERPLVFSNNDRPGIMLASAARRYVNQFAVKPGNRAVIFANNDDGYKTAVNLAEKDIDVRAVVDSRTHVNQFWKTKLEKLGVEIIPGSAVINTHGHFGLTGIDVASLSSDQKNTSSQSTFMSADLLAISGGWSPNVHLYCHAGGRPQYEASVAAFIPGVRSQSEYPAGASNGAFSLIDCVTEGINCGNQLVTELGFSKTVSSIPQTDEPTVTPIKALWRIPGKGKKFVDIQDDVTESDVKLAHQEGYISVEHLKRYTTLGMGTDQGKTSNMNGHAIMAEERGEDIETVGTTMFRPPYIPIAMGPLAGRDIGQSYSAKRKSAIHNWHHANGAVFVDAGQWLRPQYYLKNGEANTTENMDVAITREVQGTRGSVGIVDVSTLGKIDIQGADSSEFLNRIYTNGWTKLAIGKARYGLMLREDGIVFDDGTTSRLSGHHYFMTTTTSNAASVLSHMEYCLQVHWPDLDVKISSVTEQWAAMAIAGPKSRDVLQKSTDEEDLSDEALPFMGVKQISINGIPALIFRISFSGELAYEVNVPADYGEYVWRRIMEKGKTDNITPYGTEAMAIMRIEKGHVAGGELDGRTTPDDLGLNKLISSQKEFIGRRLLEREGFTDPKRPKLVGLIPIDGKSRIRTGSILVKDPNASLPMPKLGHVSSGAYLSPTLKHPISLGLITGGTDRIGETVWATSPLHGETNEVKIVDPVFYDKQGERLNG